MYPGHVAHDHAIGTTAARWRRCRRVLSESTTTISSAHATDSIASSMWAASFFVMIVTESFGTRGVYQGGKGGNGGRGRRAGGEGRSACGHPGVPGAAAALERGAELRPCEAEARHQRWFAARGAESRRK